MIVVVNSTPLIYLAAIGRFDLLRSLFGQIVIPVAVFDEVVIQGTRQWGAAETAAASWVDRRIVTDRSAVSALLGQLDLGESEVIVLAQGLGADLSDSPSYPNGSVFSRIERLLSTDCTRWTRPAGGTWASKFPKKD